MPQSPEPLVSIIIRSMDRPEISDALSSIACSDYAHIEVIIVNARGATHAPLPSHERTFEYRLVNASGPAMDRATAANFGLTCARGEFALFLDDDDLIDPNHISRLVDALLKNRDAPAAYTGVRLIDSDGKLIRETSIPWARERLAGMNFLPIHAVLFRCATARENCRFDPQLEVLEDWDFWLQLARQGDFLNVPGCSATYRLGLGQSGLSSNRDIGRFQEAHARVLQKWTSTNGFLPVSSSFIWFGTAVENLQIAANDLNTERERLISEIASLRDELSYTRWERDALSQARDNLLNSTSWRITSPLRRVSGWIRSGEKND